MKKILPLVLWLALLLSGCRQAPEPAPPDPPEEAAPRRVEVLAAEFAPTGGDPAAQLQMLGPAAEKLRAALEAQGVEVGEVRLTLGTSLAATGQAVAQGSVDLAFLPAEALVEFGGDAVPLLGAAWPVPALGGGGPAGWNGGENAWTDTLAAGRRLLVVAGPSAYGRSLKDLAAEGEGLTWEALSQARWGLCGGRGDGMASLWLAEHWEGRTLADLPRTTVYESGEALLFALAEGEADVAVIAADERIDLAGEWNLAWESGGWGRDGSIWEETAVIGVTEPFYGVTAASAPGGRWAEEEALSAALDAALLTLVEDPDFTGLAGAGPFAPVEDGALSPLRRLAELGG